MIGQPRHCEICGQVASGKTRVELIKYREAGEMENRYIQGVIHARCAQHAFDSKKVSVSIDYDYVEVAEGEALKSV